MPAPTVCPASEVPAPRGVTVTPNSRAIRTVAATSSGVEREDHSPQA
jgi:hypothetical protein